MVVAPEAANTACQALCFFTGRRTPRGATKSSPVLPAIPPDAAERRSDRDPTPTRRTARRQLAAPRRRAQRTSPRALDTPPRDAVMSSLLLAERADYLARARAVEKVLTTGLPHTAVVRPKSAASDRAFRRGSPVATGRARDRSKTQPRRREEFPRAGTRLVHGRDGGPRGPHVQRCARRVLGRSNGRWGPRKIRAASPVSAESLGISTRQPRRRRDTPPRHIHVAHPTASPRHASNGLPT